MQNANFPNDSKPWCHWCVSVTWLWEGCWFSLWCHWTLSFFFPISSAAHWPHLSSCPSCYWTPSLPGFWGAVGVAASLGYFPCPCLCTLSEISWPTYFSAWSLPVVGEYRHFYISLFGILGVFLHTGTSHKLFSALFTSGSLGTIRDTHVFPFSPVC